MVKPEVYTHFHRPPRPRMTKEIRPIVDQTANISVDQLIARVGVQMPMPFEDDARDDFDSFNPQYAYSADLAVLGDHITAAHGKVPSYPRGGPAVQRGADRQNVGAAQSAPVPLVGNSVPPVAPVPPAQSAPAGQQSSPA
jgi:hypothetical protein